jgi:hypothetical protein
VPPRKEIQLKFSPWGVLWSLTSYSYSYHKLTSCSIISVFKSNCTWKFLLYHYRLCTKQLLTTSQKTTREQNNENNNIMKPFIFPLNRCQCIWWCPFKHCSYFGLVKTYLVQLKKRTCRRRLMIHDWLSISFPSSPCRQSLVSKQHFFFLSLRSTRQVKRLIVVCGQFKRNKWSLFTAVHYVRNSSFIIIFFTDHF